jgi:hypothetical protein
MKKNLYLLLVLLTPFSLGYSQTEKKNNLNKVTSVFINGIEMDLGDDSLLKNYLKIDPVSKSTFTARQKTAVNFIDTDSTGITKKNGILKLPIKGGYKTYFDKNPFDETKQEFTYLGQVLFLNVYLIGGLYWEHLDYRFTSKINGEVIQSFSGYPYISKDKKYIISIYPDLYDTDADLELYKIINGKPENIIRTSFKNWIPAVHKVNMFWSNDGSLYVPVLSPDKFWTPDGNLNENYEYIRISIL